MSLFEDYLLERRDLHVYRPWKEVACFLTWKTTDDDGIYIQDIYVAPEARRGNIARDMADSLVEEYAPARLYGSVDFTTKNPEVGLLALLHYGFKVKSILGNGLWLCKELS